MDTKLPTLIDNRNENTGLAALRALLPQTRAWDIATGYFEVGSLLALEGLWQSVERIRLLFGDEVTRRTQGILLGGQTPRTRRSDILQQQLDLADESLERAKERDDSLTGLEAIRAALQSGQIEARVYTRAKFHAKAHRLETRPPSPVDYALIGSSNFTQPGLTENLELNLFTTDPAQIRELRSWFEEIWAEGEPVREELLKVIERHLRRFSPFEVWAKALYEYFADRETPPTSWDEQESVVYPLLSRYQQDGYRAALRIAERWGGAFVCDGVGLGKTYIGAMLLEYHLHRGDRILIIVPKSARRSVWESRRREDPLRLVRDRYRRAYRDLVEIRNHTDFGREGTVSPDDLAYYRDYVNAILVDEAHHFRTPNAHRSQALMDLAAGKRLYLLTATPINNSLWDLYHLINYLAQKQPGHFRALGIHDLRGHFRKAEAHLEALLQAEDGGVPDVQAAAQEADLLRTDRLLKALVIQRSRAYVRTSEQKSGSAPLFPEREKPQVIPYSLRQVYAGLYHHLWAAFDREEPLLSLALYNPEPFRRDAPDTETLNRDKQVIGLIRTLLLKRLESSYKAFEASLEDLLRKMAAFVQQHAPDRWTAWQRRQAPTWKVVEEHLRERQELDRGEEPEEGNELDEFEARSLDPAKYDLDALLNRVEEDMSLLARILSGVYQHLSPDRDHKLQQLIAQLREDPRLKAGKVVIFTEFRDTARYLYAELIRPQADGRPLFADVEELDSTRRIDREAVIKRFAPFYNCAEEELDEYLHRWPPLRILISTDVLSEGLNLQDANLIVNYDLHWNPVRLMQRIGRVDRRLNPEIERRLGRDGEQPLKVYVYNFLPPDEVEELLHLFRRVTGKLLRISKTLGIEAPVLTPEDDFEALRLFNEKYEGQRSIEEELHLELEQLRRDHPDLFRELPRFPRRVFSGKQVDAPTCRGLFCAYRFPSSKALESPAHAEGELRWYFRCAATGEVWESERLAEIAEIIRSTPDTPRVTSASTEDLQAWRKEIEQECVRRTLRDLQAPLDAKATLVCWMEIC